MTSTNESAWFPWLINNLKRVFIKTLLGGSENRCDMTLMAISWSQQPLTWWFISVPRTTMTPVVHRSVFKDRRRREIYVEATRDFYCIWQILSAGASSCSRMWLSQVFSSPLVRYSNDVASVVVVRRRTLARHVSLPPGLFQWNLV
jgi:hypothetical protein